MKPPLFILGEAWGEHEAKLRVPFVGPSGVEVLRQLHEAGCIKLTAGDQAMFKEYWAKRDPKCIDAVWRKHPEVFRTNVFQLRPPYPPGTPSRQMNDVKWFGGPKCQGLDGYAALSASKYVRAEFLPELQRLQKEILHHDPNLILCLGNTALWAMTGSTGIMKLRGTLLTSTHCVAGYKVLPTYHPAAILRQWENRPTVIADLMKARDEQTYTEIRKPAREIWIEPDLEDIRRFIRTHVAGCRLLSVDIETSGNRITCIGFATARDTAIVVPFDDERRKDKSYWGTAAAEIECWGVIKSLLEDRRVPKLFQNGLYDIGFLYRAYRIKVAGAAEDTMLLSHALHPESLKGLGYLGSIYTNERSWKGMRKHTKTIKRGN